MKQLFLIIIFLTGGLIVFAQNSYQAKYKSRYHFKTLSEQTLKFYDEAQDCWNNTEESCIPFYKKMLASAKAKNECTACSAIELARGYFFENEFDLSIEQLNELLKDTKHLDERLRDELELDGYNIMALNYASKGNYKQAIDYFLECGKRIDKLGKKEQAALLKTNMGRMYAEIGNYDQSILMRKEAFEELKALKITRQTANIAGGIAAAYINNQQSDSAIVWSRLTIQLAKEQADAASEIVGYYVLATSLEESKQDSAMIFVEKAIQLSKKNNSKILLSEALGAKAYLLASQKKYNEAQYYYLEAIKLEKENGKKDNLQLYYEKLGRTAYLNKDYPLSSEYLYKAIQLKDTIISAENQKLIHEFNAKYETEKKEKQIAEQELKIQKHQSNLLFAILGGALLVSVLGGIFISHRKAQRLKLKHLKQENENAVLKAIMNSEEQERRSISNTLHDSVAAKLGAAKMSMQSIPFLAEERKNEQLEKTAQLISNIHKDIRNLAHHLLPLTLEKEGLVSAISEFAGEINQLHLSEIKIDNHLSSGFSLPKRTELILYRIVQELINNVVKHSKATEATVFLSDINQQLEIQVSDNGIGFSANQENQGLYSIRERINTIGGTLDIESEEQKGSVVKLTLKC